MMKRSLLLVTFMLYWSACLAQQFLVTGVVSDSVDNASLIGVNVILQPVQDTTGWKGTMTDTNGKFTFTGIAPGAYLLKLSYIGYVAQERKVTVKASHLDIDTVKMMQSVTTLNSVEIVGDPIPLEQQGDSLVYNANAFKTNRDAAAEDLVAKMPGITIDETGIKAQGEKVQQILVDGKPFFGDDPDLALKNLPAEVIEKIEVFDQLSEQSQFTGFDDGQTRKTINIVTKRKIHKAKFGNAYAGVVEQGRYMAGGNINSFNGDRKVSLIGMSNNINQQNFGSQDLLDISGGHRNNNFMTSQQGGISTTHAIGLNYSNEWGDKVEISGSYFFNNSENERNTTRARTYITSSDSGLVYRERSMASAVNDNHRLNMRLEYKLDSFNTVVITPRLSFQQNDSRSILNGNYVIGETQESSINNNRKAHNSGYNFSNNFLFRHRFAKRGRSFSWNVNTSVNDRTGNSALYSLNEFYASEEPTLIDQQTDQSTGSYRLSSNFSYTEPVGKKGLLQLNYTPSVTKSTTRKETYDLDPETARHNTLDTLLTNKFRNTYFTNRGGVSYRYSVKKYNLMTGIDVQHAKLSSDQDFPLAFQLKRSFQNVLPQATFRYKFSRHTNLRLMYRTSTDAPSVTQLQNVIDNRNPIFLRTGNPDLKQHYNHTLSLRYGKTNIERSSSFLAALHGDYVQDYISNAVFMATKDTIVNDIVLNRGTQLSYPVNLRGRWSGRSNITYGLPLKYIKCNLNVSAGLSYSRTPAFINFLTNFAHNYTLSQGVVLSSNIQENLDFTVKYSGNYTIVENSLQKQADNNYFRQVISVRLNWLFWKGVVFNTNLNNTSYSGLSGGFNRNTVFWNAGLGYKVLRDKSLECKVTAFDILNQNRNIDRDISETYIEDRQTNVLTRYFMLTATYRIRKF